MGHANMECGYEFNNEGIAIGPVLGYVYQYKLIR